MKKKEQQKIIKNSAPKLPELHSSLDIKAVIFIFISAFLLYANTITHDYTLDDLIVLTENKYVVQGVGGFKDILTRDLFAGYYGEQVLVEGSRYRPLSLISFAVEWEFFGKRPHISHFLNVFFYALSCVLVYIVLSMLFRVLDKNRKWFLSLSFIATLIYAAHPIHTEVVANIKGRDEIFSLLFSFATLFFWIRYNEFHKLRDLLLGLILFFLALLSKENAFTFLVIIPLCIYFFTHVKVSKLAQSSFFLLIPALIYLMIRHSVTLQVTGQPIKDLMNDSFLGMSFSERYATIFYTLGYYIRLLVFPHPLTYDYYPYHIPIMNWANMSVLLSFVAYIAMAVYAFMMLAKKNIFSFIILFYLITLSISSNVFFSIGAFMNERFVFISSLAFAILIAVALFKFIDRFSSSSIWPVMAALTILLGLYSFKTITRNADWKDDYTLTMRDVQTSSNSAKSNASAGFLMMTAAEETKDSVKKAAYFEKAIFYLERAIKIHPTFSNTMINLGSVHFKYKFDYRTTIEYYLRSLQINPNFLSVYQSIFKMLDFEANTPPSVDYKINVLTRLWAIFPDKYEVNAELSKLYTLKNDQKNAAFYADRANQSRQASTSGSIF